jgi:predicted nuclease of restriction endonuclease-like (RecB) superfamily
MARKPKSHVDRVAAGTSLKSRESAAVALSLALLRDIRSLIDGARQRAAAAVNSEMVILYWSIGERIRRDILGLQRAADGEQIVHALGEQLSQEYGRGFGRTNLFYMIRFAATFPDSQIVHALSEQLSWTHLKEIIYLDEPLKREFYIQMSRIERWSTRALHDKIQGMLYERTAISRRPDRLVKAELAALRDKDRVSPDLIFRDPYLLDFLGLRDAYSEKDLEAAILRDLERFLLELGSDFTFVARLSTTRIITWISFSTIAVSTGS